MPLFCKRCWDTDRTLAHEVKEQDVDDPEWGLSKVMFCLCQVFVERHYHSCNLQDLLQRKNPEKLERGGPCLSKVTAAKGSDVLYADLHFTIVAAKKQLVPIATENAW